MSQPVFWEDYLQVVLQMVKNQIRKLIPARRLSGRPLLEGRERQGNEEAGTVRKAEENAAAGMLESEEPVAVNPVRENYERSRTPPPGYTFQPGRRT